MSKPAAKIVDDIAAAATEVSLVDGAPATRVKLLPMGEIALRDGRGPYRLRDREHAQQVVAATRAWLGTLDFNFDYDHGVKQVAAGAAGQAKAAGWVKHDGLSVEDDGIYAQVEWTGPALEALAAREYRYISPYFTAMPPEAGGDVVQLKNAALVNVGAINLPAVAAGLSEEDENMDLTALAAAAGLGADATVEQIAAAVTALKAKADASPATSTIAVAAGLAETASVEDIAAAVGTLKAGTVDLAKYVPIEQVTAMQQEIGVLSAERGEREVAAAIEEGKLSPAMKQWGLDLFKSNEKGWRDYVASAPVMVAAGVVVTGKPAEKATTLSAEEVAACAAIGMSHEDFLKAKNEEIA